MKRKSSFDEKKETIKKAPPVSDEEVDITLLRWMLSLSPAERLQVLQQNVRSILKLRNGKIHP
jgi:hypothetical protein